MDRCPWHGEPVPLRRGHDRTDPRTGRVVRVRPHEVRSQAHGGGGDGVAVRLREQADVLAQYVSPVEPGRARLMPQDYTLVTDRLSSTGHPDPWWRANRATRAEASTPDAEVPVMPERYSPSTSRTGRRTHRTVYGTGDLQVRLPSHAAMGRYLRDHPEVRVFDVPAELLSDGSRGMGMVRLARNEETRQWQVIGGTGAYGGTGEWAQRSREAVGAVVAGRRPRATMVELRAASTEARRRLEGSQSGAVAGETTTRLLPELGWTDVESSALSRVGYDPVTRRMEVQFNDGRRASYRNVPPAEHRALITSSSVGRYYTLNVRSNPAYLGHGFPSSTPGALASRVEAGPRARGQSDGPAPAGRQSCGACGRFIGPGETHVCVATSPSATGASHAPVATAAAVVRAQGAAGGADHPIEPDEGAGTERAEEGDDVLQERSDAVAPPHDRRRLEAGVALAPESGWRALRLQGDRAVMTTSSGAQVTISGVDVDGLGAFADDPGGTPVTDLGRTVALGGTGHIVFEDGGPYSQAALVLGSDSERPTMVALTADGRVVDAPLASMEEWSVVVGGSHPNAAVAQAIERRVPVQSHDGIQMLPMASTSLARAGYDAETARLRVEMHDGRGYTYQGVTAERWRGMQHASSQDDFYSQQIRGRHEVAADPRTLDVFTGTAAFPRPLPTPNGTVHAVGYSRTTRSLQVQLRPQAGSPPNTGAVYRYSDVDPETVAALMSSDDPEGLFRRRIEPLAGERLGDQPLAHRSGRCQGCGQYVGVTSAHDCPGPAGSPVQYFRAPAGSQQGQDRRAVSAALYSASWQDGTARISEWAGGTAVVGGVSEAEFNRLVADPDVTYRAWEAGRRLATEDTNGPPPVHLHLPEALARARRTRSESAHFGVEEALQMPSASAVRSYARAHPDEQFHIRVSAALNDDSAVEDPAGNAPAMARLEGTLAVHRDARGRLHATDDGTLGAGTAEQREELARTVTAVLQARRVTGEFSRLREAHLATTDRLRGAAEASRLARVEAERRVQQRAAAEELRRAGVRSWAQDHGRFQQEYRAARARRSAGEPAVPYMREDATGGLGARHGGRGFGTEIEFDFPPHVNSHMARAAILRDLKAEGVIPERHPDRWLGYTQQRAHGYEMWKCTDDGTVAGEIVSPVMYDEPESWDQLEKVCTILRRHGAIASLRTGNHVHVACGDYDHTVENHNRLLGDFHATGDVLYRLASNPERGSHRGMMWCGPNRPVPATGYSRVAEAQSSNNGHHIGLNFQSVGGNASDHVEYRMWDSTLDPGIIQTQIKVSLAMTESAFSGRTADPAHRETVGAHRTANAPGRRLEGEEWERSTRGFRGTLDRLFYRDEDKAQATSLFAVTRWQRRR